MKLSILTAEHLIHQHVTSDSSKTHCKMDLSFLQQLWCRVLVHNLSSWNHLEQQGTCSWWGIFGSRARFCCSWARGLWTNGQVWRCTCLCWVGKIMQILSIISFQSWCCCPVYIIAVYLSPGLLPSFYCFSGLSWFPHLDPKLLHLLGE